MRERWRIDLMGTPRIYHGDAIVTPLQNPKTDALLAYLAFYRQRPHSREELTDIFWADTDPATGRNRLSLALARLRQRLAVDGEGGASLLVADRFRIAIHAENVAIDVSVLERAMSAARGATPAEARITALTTAVRSYGGELLPGFYDDWVLSERRRLAEEYIAVHLSLSRLLRERNTPGDLAAAEGYARAAVLQAGTSEAVHLELVRVLEMAGRRAEALRQFQEMKRALLEDTAVPVSAEARGVWEQLQARATTPEAALLPPSAPPRARRSWIAPPAPLTRFFGREAECERIAAYVAEGVRVVTLLGAGGSGKTRLGIESARRLSEHFAGAVAWVPLAALADTKGVPDAIAEALRLDRQGTDDLQSRIVERLATVPAALLVLDNLEHLLTLPTASELPLLLRRLLEELPGLTILMTSRQRIGIEGEREVAVAPLPLPQVAESIGEQAPSVQLFVDRAQAVHPAFERTTVNASDIDALCRRLEGIPLAIELCAAWAQSLTPAQMLARLDDRFALLVSQRADTLERHRTITTAIAYSYELLGEELKNPFLRLSVFRGGWSVEAAESLGVDVRTLTALRERSLIVTGNAPEQDMRFTMLETLREFAAARQTPEEEAEGRRAHADYFLGLIEAIRPHLTGPEQGTHFAQLQTEHDNFRAALQWCLETGDAERGLRFAVALHIFWNIRGHLVEGIDWFERLEGLEEIETISSVLRASGLRTKSKLYHWRGESERAGGIAKEALRISEAEGDEQGVASAWMAIGNAAQFTGDSATARIAYEHSLASARAVGDESMTASALNNLGLTENADQKWETAYDYYAEALAIFRRIGHHNYQATALANMAVSQIYLGNLDRALPYLTEALAIHRSLGSKGDNVLVNLTVLSRRRGDYAAAHSFLREILAEGDVAHRKYLLAATVREAGHLKVAEGDFERGSYFLGAGAALCEILHLSFAQPEAVEMERSRRAIRAAIGEVRMETAWQTGRHAPLSQVVASVLQSD